MLEVASNDRAPEMSATPCLILADCAMHYLTQTCKMGFCVMRLLDHRGLLVIFALAVQQFAAAQLHANVEMRFSTFWRAEAVTSAFSDYLTMTGSVENVSTLQPITAP